MMLHEVLEGYSNGQFKEEDVFLYRNNPQMKAILRKGSLIWCDDKVAISCKGILQDVWTKQEQKI
ncbi:hypothetical protein [Bacillus sp. TL12]|uniref:hypothetical protein n=1 Tax=Bacillus sp. TL12 TaxID=2894756 RepID=UPI001F51ACD0|nr:hypothetical protein [Bacillus sp. TL12]MCI0768422.1 hypothetical protein [Bacillus sp. TL12]